jgi:putative drug exporter of the RND superfamily
VLQPNGDPPRPRPSPEDAAEAPVGPAARAAARLIVWLRFLVPLAVVGVAVVTYERLPGVSALPSSPLTGLIPQHSPALSAERWMLTRFRFPLTARAAVVQRDPRGLSARVQARIVATAVEADRRALADGGRTGFAVPVLNTGGLAPAARNDGTTAITYLVYPPSVSAARQADRTTAYARRASGLGVRAYPTGVLVGELAQAEAIAHSLQWVEAATLAVVVVILAIYLRSLGAPIVTLLAAGLAYVISTHVVAWLGMRTGRSVPREVEPLMVVLLLGVVTDYSVFFMAGTRRRLAAGEPRLHAVRATTTEFLPIIATAGLLVAGGVATLRAARIHFFQALGPAMAVTVVIGMLVSAVLVPAVLALFGRLVLWPGARAGTAPVRSEGMRVRITSLFARRRSAALVALACAAALAAAASGVLHTRLGLGPISDLRAGQPARVGAREAAAGFAEGIVAPTVVLLRGHGVGADPVALARLQALIEERPQVAGVLGPADLPLRRPAGVFRTAGGNAARFAVVFHAGPYSASGIQALRELERSMPHMLSQAGLRRASVAYAGDTAIAQTAIDDMHHDILLVGLVVVAVNLVILAIFLRSLVAPLYLVAASLLAVAATLGLTTYLFQDLLGYGQLTYYFPLTVGVLLVSFGADYNVFLVGRIWQRSHRLPLREAVTATAPRASRAISIAGLALALSFATLAIIPLASFAELAFAMGAGILLDTFVVRSLLLPAVVSAVGEGSWWPLMHERARAALRAQRPDL